MDIFVLSDILKLLADHAPSKFKCGFIYLECARETFNMDVFVAYLLKFFKKTVQSVRLACLPYPVRKGYTIFVSPYSPPYGIGSTACFVRPLYVNARITNKKKCVTNILITK